MNDQLFTPEEFARVISLPADHPDRRRLESSTGFEAWRRMHQLFETAEDASQLDPELAASSAMLARRIEQALPAVAAPIPDEPRRRARLQDPGPFATLIASLRRPAFAFAMVVIVMGGAWWFVASGPQHPVMRNSGGELALSIAAPREVPGGIELYWTAVDGADHYDVVFLGEGMREIARLPDVAEPRLAIRRDALPAGLRSGATVLVEIRASRRGDPLGRPGTVTMRVP